MAEIILVILVILWILGFVRIPWINIPDFTVFEFNGRPIDLREIIIFILILWVISVLPKPLRLIVGILFSLWVLTLIGILAVSGLSNLLLLAVIIGLFLYLFGFTN